MVLAAALAVFITIPCFYLLIYLVQKTLPADKVTGLPQTALSSKTLQPVEAPPPPPPPPQPEPHEDMVAENTIHIEPQQYLSYRFEVTEAMIDCRLKGHFRARGGGHNDVQIVVAQEDEFENWINGHYARVIRATGKMTAGNLEVRMKRPGTYVLGISNTFSTFSGKDVELDFRMAYLQLP